MSLIELIVLAMLLLAAGMLLGVTSRVPHIRRGMYLMRELIDDCEYNTYDHEFGHGKPIFPPDYSKCKKWCNYNSRSAKDE